MQKEKVIYKGESRVVRIDEKQRKYILYDHKKVYLDKKGGNPFALSSSGLPTPSGRNGNNFGNTVRRVATTASATAAKFSKTAAENAPNFLSAVTAAAEATAETMPSPLNTELTKIAKERPPK